MTGVDPNGARTPADVPDLTLAEFLEQRLAEDEQCAPRLHRADCAVHALYSWGYEYEPQGCDCGVPARVLRDVAAKRRIVELHALDEDGCRVCAAWDDAWYVEGRPRAPWPCPTLRLLAEVYADHADYRPEWRPDA